MPLTFPNLPAIVSPLAAGEEKTPSSTPRRRYHAPAIIRFWHLASFDAPTVALAWSLGFAWVARLRLPAWVLVLQVLVVWAVYVGDRLLDARNGLRRWETESSCELRERHYFHWRHRRILLPLALFSICAAVATILRCMPVGVRERDSVLAAASLAYFTRVHAGRAGRAFWRARRILSKELLVGVLFTVGCALPAWSHGDWILLAAPVALFAALAWLNCRSIEAWESKAGLQTTASVPHPFRLIAIGREAALFRPVFAGIFLAGCGAIAAVFLFPLHPRAAALLVSGATGALLLAALDRCRNRLTPLTLRAAADLALLAPALVLGAAWLVRR